jgi:hypothetical protein
MAIKTASIYVEEETYYKFAALCKKQHRSMNGQINIMIEETIKAAEQAQKQEEK